ncbi:monocarboxylate transporter 12-B-like [Haliotis rufescens]|uniref:monocarboxylate transporter 12-B-like n=1 Tax=Haliotis rufescens TaxID=6454 RepID=UPI00201EE7CA|nr:monocarboxylate transporter 12-B-like [Haliotis rufescens]
MKIPKEDVDHGYAWAVLAACFAIEVLYGVLICSVGVITPAILEEVDGDLVKVSWVGSTVMGTFTMCGPLVGIIQERIGHRWTGIVGGILMLVGLTAASFCRTVTGLILTFGVITGLGCGLAANVSGVAPGKYFHKRLPVAYGIIMSGGALGLLAVGPLTIQLLDHYTLSGTLLMLGAIGFHVCLAGALIRPSSTLMPEMPVSKELDRQEYIEGGIDSQGDDAQHNPVDYGDLPGETETDFIAQRDVNNCSLATLPGVVKESGLREENATFAPLLDHRSHSSNKKPKCGMISESVSFIGTNGFFFYLLSILFWALAEAICMVHLPNYAEYKGSTPAQSASLFTGMGVTALFAGMLTGFASSDQDIGNIILHVGLQGMSGVYVMLLPTLSQTYILQMVFSALYGTYSQGPYTLVSPICIELIGRSKLAVGYGICSFFF